MLQIYMRKIYENPWIWGRPPWARLGTGGMGQVKSGWGESFGISMIIII